ncbi:MAG: protein kinase [Synechococcales cyanobacterium C42_A2020_086]|jgi:serine/threonine protein kinase|nr:protein kinase [Synechococcales cyanobacterium C42_A2020_086]
MPAKIIKFGDPETESERSAIQYLSGHLSDDYCLYTNLEIPQNGQLYEVDIILVAPHAVYVIDVKGVYGRVEVDYAEWYPLDHRQPYPSPLKKYRQHARVLKGLIADANPPKRKELQRIWVQACVLLTTENVEIIDVSRDQTESRDIISLGEECLKYFRNWQGINAKQFETKITPHLSTIDRAIRGRSQPRSRPQRFGTWEVIEKLGEKENRYVEYLARRVTIGLSNRTARLRVYAVDPWLDPAERSDAYRLINTAFQAVDELPKHDNILEVKDSFESDDADSIVLVIEDIKGQSLRQLIRYRSLTLEQKMNLIGDVLRALEHAHQHGVIHRNITPDAILVTPDKQAKLTDFDYARLENRTATIADAIVEDLDASSLYQDFDCQRNPAAACQQSDLYSAGQVFYEMLLGQPAFQSVEDLLNRGGVFPIAPSQAHPDLPKGFDEWLQKLCAFDRRDRFASAQEALDQLTPLCRVVPDLTNLPPETILDNQYQVIERLGKPGSFAVAYKVLDSFSEDFQVLKIVIRDRYSTLERVQQEFKILYKILNHPHPHVVTVRWAGQLHEYDHTPFLILEYVEGRDLQEQLATSGLTLEEAIQVWRQTADGLAYLHAHGIYHQDIKPSNLLLTPQGVKIIDFNIAVSAASDAGITAGTRRYLPPDFRPSVEPSESERIDRDLYALGVTAYECITGHYPFNAAYAVLGQPCLDPRSFEGCADLSDELVALMQRAIAPLRSHRFQSADELMTALNALLTLRQKPVDSRPAQQPLASEDSSQVTLHPLETPASETSTSKIPNSQVPAETTFITAPPNTEIIPVEPSTTIESDESNIQEGAADFSNHPHLAVFEQPASSQYYPSPNPEQPIVLDPSKAYPVPAGYVQIDTEVDWIRYLPQGNQAYWVRGNILCNWTEVWLQSWQQHHKIAEIKQPPKEKLAALLSPIAVPESWTDQQCLPLAIRLESYPDQPIARCLAELTDSDPQVWISEPSVLNLAQWLAIEVPEELRPLERAWQAQRRQHELGRYYAVDQKQDLLRRWLGIAEPKFQELGVYPASLPTALASEFEQYWEHQLYRTEVSVLDTLSWNDLPGQNCIAQIAYRVLSQQPAYVTKERIDKLRQYLTYDQRQALTQRQCPPEPSPLSPNASPEEALAWATQAYLPLRYWETTVDRTPIERQKSDRLAASFVDWILNHYPQMKVDKIEQSFLNYSVAHEVQQISQTNPVLWVVIDGLGWLDHQALLSLLMDEKQLRLYQELRPRFSILPTKTEYAKWSLYSQCLPEHPAWIAEASRGFDQWSNAKRYTDHDVRQQRLQKDLQQESYGVYCWDTDRFDSLYHNEVDWQELYEIKRPRMLRDIAGDILRFVKIHPKPDDLYVVIASDHGQLMGTSTKLAHCPETLRPQGRMAVGRADDPRFAVLDQQRYGLPHDITVIRGSQSFSSFSYADDKSVIGCHGGLYPEEVVVGFSVLKLVVQRAPVLVKVSGQGKPRESGQLTVEINNPNSLRLSQLKLFINEIPSLKQGVPLQEEVLASERRTLQLPVQNCPELPPRSQNKDLKLTGRLEFTFQDTESASASLDDQSFIEIHQMFSSGIESIDDFL